MQVAIIFGFYWSWCGAVRVFQKYCGSAAVRNFEIFFGRLPRVLPARENRISTQGAVRKILRRVICPYGACLVCSGFRFRIPPPPRFHVPLQLSSASPTSLLFSFKLCSCSSRQPLKLLNSKKGIVAAGPQIYFIKNFSDSVALNRDYCHAVRNTPDCHSFACALCSCRHSSTTRITHSKLKSIARSPRHYDMLHFGKLKARCKANFQSCVLRLTRLVTRSLFWTAE